jgi:redox-sensitive bicupin YhaK (pirin superfamily)
MLTPVRYDDLGRFENDWLNAHYHFSFADYHNPNRMHFETLRVINDDIVCAGSGFDFHPHRDMEIITYVRSGTIIHQDSMGNEGRTNAGDVQVMSAGTGLLHAEKSDPDTDTKLFQIWIYPREKGVTPRWDQRTFPKDPVTGALPVLVSGRAQHQKTDALLIHQDATLYGGRMRAGTMIKQNLLGPAYGLISSGDVTINGVPFKEGDGVEIRDEDHIDIAAESDCEIILIDL